jgi:hypothetical protein
MTPEISVNFKLTANLSKIVESMGAASKYAVFKAIDEVGNKAKTQVIRETAKQAGVKYGRALAVISSRQAMGAGAGQYVITARDVTMALKEFAPARTPTGISAAPWGKRKTFEHSFLGPGGHDFVRTSKKRLPIRKLWGPAIPKEMVRDKAEAAFYAVTGQLMEAAMAKWLLRAGTGNSTGIR